MEAENRRSSLVGCKKKIERRGLYSVREDSMS